MVVTIVVLVLLLALLVGRTFIRSYYYVLADNGNVSVMRGIPQWHELHQLACINARNEVSEISPDKKDHPECQLLKVNDLRQAQREQVQSGMPIGTLEGVRDQLRKLVTEGLLPPCPPQRQTSSTEPSAPSTRSSGTPETNPPSAPGGPTTTSSPAPSATQTTPPSTTASSTSPAAPAPSASTVTETPQPEQRPGVDCRAVA